MHHGRSRKQVVHVVHTKYEVNPSIIRDCRPIQTTAVENLVFDPLTIAPDRYPSRVLISCFEKLRKA